MTPPTTRNLIVAGGMLLALFLGWQIPSRPWVAFGLLGLLFGIATLQWHGKIAVVLMVTTISSGFILPHPVRPYIWELSSVFAVSGVITSLAFRRWPKYAALFFHRNLILIAATIAYASLLGILMIKHGAGLRVLGASSMGGRFYLQQIIMLPLPICAILFPVKEKTAIRLVLIQILLSFSFIISEVFFRFQLPGASLVLRIVELQSDTLNFTIQQLKGGISRFQSLGTFAYNLGIALLILFSIRSWFTKRGFFLIPVFALLFLLTGLGGSRRLAVQLIFIVAFMGWAQKRVGLREIFFGCAVGFFLLGMIYTQVDTLPLAIQRTLSFLPGLEVDPMAQADADITMTLRRQLRSEAFRVIRENFWTGTGFDVDRNLRLTHNPTIGPLERHVAMGRFYAGPLGIFATLGVFPFLLFWCLHVGILLLCHRLVSMIRTHTVFTLLDRMALLLTARYLVNLLIYIFFTGDANFMLRTFIPSAMILMLFERIYVLKEKRPADTSPSHA